MQPPARICLTYAFQFNTEKPYKSDDARKIKKPTKKHPFGCIDGISDVYRCQPPKSLQPCEFRAVRKKKKAVKNVFDHRFDHLHDHNLITIGV